MQLSVILIVKKIIQFASNLMAFCLLQACISPVQDTGMSNQSENPDAITGEILTATPFPLCTPPLCGDDESYFCPDECPGGCGTTCATHTPSTAGVIESSSKDDSIDLPSAEFFPDPADYVWQPIVSGLEKPLGLTNAKDGSNRLFILEQPGVIRVVQNGRLTEPPFLDIQNKVEVRSNEQGLLGLAFHPAYMDNGWFFVNYTGEGGDTFISRFSVMDGSDTANLQSEIVLMRIKQPYANHNGGHLAFGPDGYLYIGMGDGGSAGDPDGFAQNPDSLLGKMLRINVDRGNPYAVPGENPYAFGGGKQEIWAVGMRNPWRYSFDRYTGDLFIGDVGQNQWEEINYFSSSQTQDSSLPLNFGWDYWEGFHLYEGESPEEEDMIFPIWEYPHEDGCSVTGGVVYRGMMPAWQGIYFYGDYCTGTIWGLLRSRQGDWLNAHLFSTGANITSFGEDEQGEIYLVDQKGTVFILIESR
jgi:glucose/arabinose dehydrogenase